MQGATPDPSLAEPVAAEGERRLRLALDAAGVGDWDLDLVANVARCSFRNDQCFGYSEPVPHWDYEFFLAHVHPDDRERVNASFQRAREHQGEYDVEFRVVWPDGSLHWLWSRGSFFFDEHGVAIRATGVQIDITARREVSEALRRSERLQAQAEAANAAKTTFLTQMSHELRTPLNAIIGFSQLLAIGSSGPLTERQHRQLGLISDAGDHLLSMIDDILDLSRIDMGSFRVEPRPIEVASFLRECLDMVKASAGERSMRLRLADVALHTHVMADPTRIRQIMLNLLSNAIKYTQVGGQVQVGSAVTADGWVELRVADNGPGLTPDQLGHLFEPFNRLGQENGHAPGTGIGLALSKRLAHLMGGVIDVEASPGQGCAFTLRLPAATALPRPAAAAPSPTADTLAPLGRQRILYIEDDEVNAELMGAMLATRPQVELEVQASGSAGLLAARTRLPDLVMLDMELPDMSGLDVIRELKADPVTRGIPLVMVSASAWPESASAALDAGASQYLPKPMKLEAMLAAIGKALR